MASLSLWGIDPIVCGVCLYSICRMKPMGDQYVWTSDRRLPTPSVWCWSHSGDLTDSAKCALVWIASPGALLIMSARSTRLRACAETSASQSDGIKANFNTYKGYLIRKNSHPRDSPSVSNPFLRRNPLGSPRPKSNSRLLNRRARSAYFELNSYH